MRVSVRRVSFVVTIPCTRYKALYSPQHVVHVIYNIIRVCMCVCVNARAYRVHVAVIKPGLSTDECFGTWDLDLEILIDPMVIFFYKTTRKNIILYTY